MNDQIKPALTAKEWADRIASDGWRGAIVDFGRCACGSRMLANLLDPSLLPKSRHQLAALALHGQPFGFTREDVRNEMLAAEKCERLAESSLDTVCDDDNVPELLTRAYLHRSLAARIEALLPPEDHK